MDSLEAKSVQVSESESAFSRVVKNAGKVSAREGSSNQSKLKGQARAQPTLYCLSFWLDSKAAEVRPVQSIAFHTVPHSVLASSYTG